MKDVSPSQPHSGHLASPRYANYVLAVLFLVYVFNFIDRQILGILLDDIKAELEVSDPAMGLLVGFTFVVFYTLAGIPIARLADRLHYSVLCRSIFLGQCTWGRCCR